MERPLEVAANLPSEDPTNSHGGAEQQATPVPKEKPALQYLASRPVNVQSEEEMRAVVERHQRWIASVLNPRADVMEGRANISGSDVSGFDLSGLDLRGVNFSKCVMHGTNLQNCDLNGANFGHASLQGADLRGASVRRAIFDYADLRDAEVDGVDFSQTSLTHAILSRNGSTSPKEIEALELQSEESSSCNATTGSSPLVEANDLLPDSSI